MGRLKSGIILKDQVFVPDYDSYTDMLKELNIENDEFVCAELSPVDGSIFSDLSTWQFNINQDMLPDWFIYERDKQRMVEAVKKWLKDHVFKNVDDLLELKGNDKYYLKNCKNVEAYDNCKIIARGNCTIKVYDNCTINACNNSIVEAFNNSTVYALNNSTVYAQNKSTISAFNNSTVYAFNNCTVDAHNKSEVNAYDNCIVKAYDDSNINAYNDSIIESIDRKFDDKKFKRSNKRYFY